MWSCPKCGREFKRTNQGHYCGNAPTTVEEYIRLQPPEAQPHLIEIRDVIYHSVLDVKEYIAWSMPVYKTGRNTVSFAACKKYVSFYAGTDAIEAFKAELGGYETKKNAIYFPYTRDIPLKLMERIVKWCLK